MSVTETSKIEELANQEYKYGFVTEIESESLPKGLNEEIILKLSAIKHEPPFMLEWRLKAYRHWLNMEEPHWPNVKYSPIDYQDLSYYSAPKKKPQLNSLDEVDPGFRLDDAFLGQVVRD
jgi:Fe-S cluster assembly protein SufB